MTSIKDVASYAGVSAQTVSNVLNNPAIVKPETRHMVKKAIRELNYTPNITARRLRTQKANTIALGIYPEGSSPIFDEFLHAMAVETDAHNIRLLIYKADSVEEQIHQYEKLTMQGDVDAFVLLDIVHNDERINWMLSHHQNFVLFGRPWGFADSEQVNPRNPADADPISWVDVDSFSGVYELTQQLILQGKKRIGFIGTQISQDSQDTPTQRYNGWKQAILQAHMVSNAQAIDELSIFTTDDLTAAQDATVALTDSWPDLDAIVCTSDTIAAGAMLALGQFNGFSSNYDPSNDSNSHLTITGFDNSELSQSLGFTSIKQPIPQVAHEIVQVLTSDEKISETKQLPPHKLLKPSIMWR